MGKQVLCIETGDVYNSLTEAHEWTGICISSICAVCRGQRKTAGEYHWTYCNEKKNRLDTILESMPPEARNEINYLMKDSGDTFYMFLMKAIKYCADNGKEIDIKNNDDILDGIKFYLSTGIGCL